MARELSRLTGLPVFHNHLVVDVLLEVFEFGPPEFVALREQVWLATFGTAAASGRSLIFTFAPGGTVKPRFPHLTVETIEAHHGQVRFVELHVTDPEQERRIVALGAFPGLLAVSEPLTGRQPASRRVRAQLSSPSSHGDQASQPAGRRRFGSLPATSR